MRIAFVTSILCGILSLMACFVIMMDGFDQAPWDTWSIINLGMIISGVFWAIVAIWSGSYIGQKRPKRSVPLWLRIILMVIATGYLLVAGRFALGYLFAQNLAQKPDDLPQVNIPTS